MNQHCLVIKNILMVLVHSLMSIKKGYWLIPTTKHTYGIQWCWKRLDEMMENVFWFYDFYFCFIIWTGCNHLWALFLYQYFYYYYFLIKYKKITSFWQERPNQSGLYDKKQTCKHLLTYKSFSGKWDTFPISVRLENYFLIITVINENQT